MASIYTRHHVIRQLQRDVSAVRGVYGERCWELEAIPTDTLREIVDGTIQRTINMDLFRSELEIQRQEQQELNEHRLSVRNCCRTWTGKGMTNDPRHINGTRHANGDHMSTAFGVHIRPDPDQQKAVIQPLEDWYEQKRPCPCPQKFGDEVLS